MLSPSSVSLFCMQTSWNPYGNIIWCCSWGNWEERVEWFTKDHRDLISEAKEALFTCHVWAPSTWTSLGSLPVGQCPSHPSQLFPAFGSYPEGLDAGIKEHNITVIRLILGQTTEGRIKCAWSTGLEKSPETYLNEYMRKVKGEKSRVKKQIWSVLWIKL